MTYAIERQDNGRYKVVGMDMNGEITVKTDMSMHDAEALAHKLNNSWGRR